MKVFLKELFIKPINTIFIIIGLIISIFSFSIATGLFNSVFNYYNDKNYLYKDNINVIFNFNEGMTMSNFMSTITKKDNSDEGFFTSKFTIETNEKNRVNFLAGVYGYENLDKVYPLLEGRYFTEDESRSDENIALVGSEIYDMTYEKNGEIYINILGEEYKVIGKLGRKTASYFGIFVLVPASSLPSEIYNEEATNISVFYSDNIESEEYFTNLKSSFDDKNLQSIDVQKIAAQNVVEQVIDTNKSMYISMIFSILLSLISMLIFSNFWADEMKRNIAIKKVLGADNVYILKQIVIQMLVLVLVSAIVASGLNILAIKFLEKVFMIKITFNIVNMICVTSAAFILIILNSLWIYKDIFNFDILKFIKAE